MRRANPCRLLILGLGPLGRKIALDALARADLQIVAAVDPLLAGRPLGDALRDPAGQIPSGTPELRILTSLADLPAGTEADAAIVATLSDLSRSADTFRDLSRRGVCVVSTCEEMLYPRLRHPELAHELDEIARTHGARLLGTGVNPGFVMDTLPIVLSSVCRDVRAVRVLRRQDATTRRIPFQKKIGATMSLEQFRAGVQEGWLRHVGLGESLHLVADAMGWRVDEWSETIEPILAERDLACGLGPIPAGHARGVRQVAAGIVAGREALHLEFIAAIAEPDPCDEVHLESDPPISMRISPNIHGDVATSAIAINAVAALRRCPPGLHTMATIPPAHWRNPV